VTVDETINTKGSSFNFPFPTLPSNFLQYTSAVHCWWEAFFNVSSAWYLFAQLMYGSRGGHLCAFLGRRFSVLPGPCRLQHSLNLPWGISVISLGLLFFHGTSILAWASSLLAEVSIRWLLCVVANLSSLARSMPSLLLPR